MRRVLAILAVLGFAGYAFADCGECGSKEECSTAECSSSECASSECASSGCCMEKAMAALPKLIFRVSDHETACMEEAKKFAEHHEDDPMLYVVGDTTFENMEEAYTALADATETFVADFAEPKTCAVSGTTSLAGHSIGCSEKAAMMASAIKEAMDTVHVSYKVGDETCSCPTKAKTMAEESGEEQLYVVGDAETCCAIDARIKVAQAKYKAAVMALAKLQAETEEVETATVES